MIDAKAYGPWALIAGASEGLGVSFAHQLAKAGLNLVLIARQKDLLERVARDVTVQSSVRVRVLPADLAGPDILERVREVTDNLEVGLLVFNAAASPGLGTFLDATLDAVLKAVRLGPVGQTSLAHHFAGRMAARHRGGIILIGSLAGNAGAATTVLYSAAKAFAQIFAEGLWSELKPLGVMFSMPCSAPPAHRPENGPASRTVPTNSSQNRTMSRASASKTSRTVRFSCPHTWGKRSGCFAACPAGKRRRR